MAADELDLNGLKTASGEIIEDGGPISEGILKMECPAPFLVGVRRCTSRLWQPAGLERKVF